MPRNSSGWATLRKRLQAEPGLRVIDVGYTSPTNINYLTSLGHSVFMVDLVQDALKGEWQKGTDEFGKPILNVQKFLDTAFDFGCGPPSIISPNHLSCPLSSTFTAT